MESYTSLLEHAPCNLCGADDYSIVYPAQYDRATTENLAEIFRSSGDEILVDQLVRCNVCGLQYLNPRLRQDLILDGYSAGTDETFVSQNAARERTFERSLNTLEKHSRPPGRILDIGTGGGAFLHVARQRGWQVAGCEPNRWMCEWAQEHYGLDIVPGTIFDMQLEDRACDVVTLWDVLEHTPDPKAVLQECHRVLKPGGLLVVNYPDIGSLIARLMGRKWVFLLSIHLYYFTPQTIQHMLHEAGFDPFLRRPHWQTLELGYILFRMQAYARLVAQPARFVARKLGVERAQVPYWVGQTLVMARRTT